MTMKLPIIHIRLLITALAIVLAPSALAGDDQTRARQLYERGEILSLEAILKQHGIERLLEAELEHERGHWIYEVEYLDETGRVHEQYFDARTGQAMEDDD